MKKLSYLCWLILFAMSAMAGCSSWEFDQTTAHTPAITDSQGNTVAGSIASLETLNLGGVEQTILIRGEDASKPVLLFLHGGPGGAHIPFYREFQTPELEQNFVVVQWDQRGAGKSYSDRLTREDMRVDKYLSDIRDLTNYLRSRFNQEKIFMLGHSWGSAMGFLTIAQTPELYHAYIGAGEAADWNRRQTISYEWALEQARERNQKVAITELERLAPFDYSDIEAVSVKDKWVSEFGGHHHQKAVYQRIRSQLGKGSEYTAADVEKFMKGLDWSSRTADVEAAASNYSLFKQLPEVSIPVYFFAGRYDYSTPATLAEEYYSFLKAPKKAFIWFENSAHTMIFEEPDKMTRELIKIAQETLK
ncbi:alpha/beta hydrolase [Pseudomaricurvus alkylphenolicus]|uniref:alpha/beta fold hydrolase n=1 Tax=Pseudomaricurvus alkylphenolicus TaxID=1306991 RepID=UPI00141E9EE7|nr:alpha/beta hydrolase [Pseudomaricurvus alkylphenolicus]NIB38426.1 alpha/beta hydrolase [Pseudomaricurvus alkylphenolicus]